jgi:hypothetical protein
LSFIVTTTGADFCATGPDEPSPAKLVEDIASAAMAVPAAQYPLRMAETLPAEQIPGRLAEIRDQLKLLADYL